MRFEKPRARAFARAFLVLPMLLVLGGKSFAQSNEDAPQVFGVWAYGCADAACQVYTTLNDPNTDQLVVGWSIIQDPQTKAINAVAQLPLGPALPVGVMVRVDPDGAIPAPFQTCTDAGCSVVLQLDDAFVDKMRAGTGLSVEYVVYGQTERKMVNAPLEGFADALDALEKGSNP